MKGVPPKICRWDEYKKRLGYFRVMLLWYLFRTAIPGSSLGEWTGSEICIVGTWCWRTRSTLKWRETVNGTESKAFRSRVGFVVGNENGAQSEHRVLITWWHCLPRFCLNPSAGEVGCTALQPLPLLVRGNSLLMHSILPVPTLATQAWSPETREIKIIKHYSTTKSTYILRSYYQVVPRWKSTRTYYPKSP